MSVFLFFFEFLFQTFFNNYILSDLIRGITSTERRNNNLYYSLIQFNIYIRKISRTYSYITNLIQIINFVYFLK